MDKPDWTCPWCMYCKDLSVKFEQLQTKQNNERLNACLVIITDELNKEYIGNWIENIFLQMLAKKIKILPER